MLPPGLIHAAPRLDGGASPRRAMAHLQRGGVLPTRLWGADDALLVLTARPLDGLLRVPDGEDALAGALDHLAAANAGAPAAAPRGLPTAPALSSFRGEPTRPSPARVRPPLRSGSAVGPATRRGPATSRPARSSRPGATGGAPSGAPLATVSAKATPPMSPTRPPTAPAPALVEFAAPVLGGPSAAATPIARTTGDTPAAVLAPPEGTSISSTGDRANRSPRPIPGRPVAPATAQPAGAEATANGGGPVGPAPGRAATPTGATRASQPAAPPGRGLAGLSRWWDAGASTTAPASPSPPEAQPTSPGTMEAQRLAEAVGKLFLAEARRYGIEVDEQQ